MGRRRIRTGFFPEDPDFVDAEAVVLAEREAMKWRYMDDASLSAPVLERNNVGMGMLVLNRPQGLDLSMINDLYTRLRNLEVNSLKRFVGITAADFERAALHPKDRRVERFCMGLDPQELLLAAVMGQQDGRLPRFSRALLWNHQELAHLIADYYKPVVCQLNGLAAGTGGGFACLPSFSGAHRDSEVVVDSCMAGLAPSGGLSYVLGRLKWHLGEFLALTAWPVRGADLVYLGLSQHWLTPEALPFLELTSEKQLEVSEADAQILLEEHSMPLPEGLTDTDSVPRKILPLVQEAFSETTVPKIIAVLQGMGQSGDPERQVFAGQCLERMSRAEPLALYVTLRLVQEARKKVRVARTHQQQDKSALPDVLTLELRAQHRLLCGHAALIGLHALCTGRIRPEAKPPIWSRTIKAVTVDEVDDVVKPPTRTEDFSVVPRAELSLSRHPRMRKYHPDYDPRTGLDHDPEWMAAEARRWDPSLFAEERQIAVRSLLGGADPAALGQARYVRQRSR